MFVLSEHELARMKDQQMREYVPEIRNLTLLQSEVEELLNSNSGLTAEQRLGLINRAQIRFDNLKKQTAKPLTTSKQELPKPENVAIEEEPDVEEEHPDEAIIQGLGEKHREKAIHIMNYINDFPDAIKYNPKSNHACINGKIMKTTNIKQLIDYLLTDTPKSHAPMGAASFMNALNTINFPKELIYNSYLKPKKVEIVNTTNDVEPKKDQTGFGISKKKRKAIFRFVTSKKPRLGTSKTKKPRLGTSKTNALRIY